jgi:hypothetical protein
MDCVNKSWFHQFIPLIVLSESLSNYSNNKARRKEINQVPEYPPAEVIFFSETQLTDFVKQEVKTE